jgi:hypothetical protein
VKRLIPKPLPRQPGGLFCAKTAGALKKRKSNPASNATQTKGGLGLRKADNADPFLEELPNG